MCFLEKNHVRNEYVLILDKDETAHFVWNHSRCGNTNKPVEAMATHLWSLLTSNQGVFDGNNFCNPQHREQIRQSHGH